MASTLFFKYWKPVGVLSTTLATPHGRSIMDSLSSRQRKWLLGVTEGRFVVPVGRLDKDSSGLLLLTTNESITASLLRPGNCGSPFAKTYIVETRRRVQTSFIEQMSRGNMELSIRSWGDKKKVFTLPCVVERLEEKKLKFVLREGKHRQIRKMLGSRGHDVKSLHRVSFGCVSLDGMSEGEIRQLDLHEHEGLMSTLAEKQKQEQEEVKQEEEEEEEEEE